MKVLYDISKTGCRYMSDADMRIEAAFLGLDPTSTILELLQAVNRLGLNDYSPGRAVKGGVA